MHIINEYVMVVRDVSIDKNDGMVSLFKIIDNFSFGLKEESFKETFGESFSKTVALPAVYTIATSWRLEKKAEKDIPLSLQMSIISPDGTEMNKSFQEAVIAKGTDHLRFNINTQGLPVRGPGYYHIRVAVLGAGSKKIAEGTAVVSVDLNVEKSR